MVGAGRSVQLSSRFPTRRNATHRRSTHRGLPSVLPAQPSLHPGPRTADQARLIAPNRQLLVQSLSFAQSKRALLGCRSMSVAHGSLVGLAGALDGVLTGAFPVLSVPGDWLSPRLLLQLEASMDTTTAATRAARFSIKTSYMPCRKATHHFRPGSCST